MNSLKSDFGRLHLADAWLKGLIEILFYTPILMLIARYLFPEWNVWIWLLTLPMTYALGALIAVRMDKPRLIVRFGCALAIGIVHGLCLYAISGGELVLPLLGGAFISTVFAFRGMSMALQGWMQSFTNIYMLIGLFSYPAIQPVIYTWPESLGSYKGTLILLGIIAIIVSAFMLNERHLSLETHESVSAAAASGFKRQNRFILAILTVLLILIGLFRSIQRVVEQWLQALWSWIMKWFNRPPEASPEEAPPPTQPPMDWDSGEAPKPSPAWMEILEQIIKIVVVILIVAAAAILLFFLARKLYQVLKKLANKLLKRSESAPLVQEEYVDEVESLMSWSKWNRQLRSRLRKIVPGGSDKGWEHLSNNAERIRFLYAKQLQDWSRKGKEPEAHFTPRETISQMSEQLADSKAKQEYNDFAALYEEVRYGEKQPLDEQVTLSKKLIDKKG